MSVVMPKPETRATHSLSDHRELLFDNEQSDEEQVRLHLLDSTGDIPVLIRPIPYCWAFGKRYQPDWPRGSTFLPRATSSRCCSCVPRCGRTSPTHSRIPSGLPSASLT